MSLALALLMVGSLLQAATVSTAVAEDNGRPEVPEAEPTVPGTDGLPVLPRPESHEVTPAPDPAAAWPEPGQVELALPGGSSAAFTLPTAQSAVRLVAPPVAALHTEPAGAPPTATVETHDEESAEAAGIPNGVLLSLTVPEGTEQGALAAPLDPVVAGRVGVELDYAAFAGAFGGNYGSRLTFVQLPACAVDQSAAGDCRERQPVRSVNDTERQVLTAPDVVLEPGEPLVLAAVAADEGEQGDHKASQLSPSASWEVGLNTGDFTWSYPMPAPDVPGGLVPELSLGYSSGAIDGRTGGTNNQGSWAGDGFDFGAGYIERRYVSCAEEGVENEDGFEVGDLCWDYDNAILSLGGGASELVPDGTDTWRLPQDDGTVVERLTGTSRGNGARSDEHWRVTDPEGTEYYFGYHRLPGWSSGDETTDSTWTVPVYGDDAGDPCYQSATEDAWCQQAWRWNLDYVVDVRGNAMAYFYDEEENSYGRFLDETNNARYTRGGSLQRIEYGHDSDDLYSGQPMGRVRFANEERCLPGGGADCSDIDANPQYWYDTPWDLNCTATEDCDAGRYSPTFWTTKRLAQVTTEIHTGGAWEPVDSWTLTHRWGTADVDYQLLLASVQHTGHTAAEPVSLPPVTFGYTQLVNRLDETGDGRAPFVKGRLSSIADEAGGVIDVGYSDPVCETDALPTPHTNTSRCFPQYLGNGPDQDPDLEWFHKYVTTEVTLTDRTGGAPDQVSRYDYRGGAAWHYNDDGLVPDDEKTWSQWRGYQHVRVRTGGQTEMLSQSDSYFLRGMHGDRAAPSGGTRTVTVELEEGEGDPITDHESAAGFLYRTVDFDGPDGQVLAKTVSRPWHHETASETYDWGTRAAHHTGVARETTFTSLDQGAGDEWRTTQSTHTYDTVAGRLTQTHDQGDLADDTDDRCTRVEFPPGDLLTLPSRVETVAVACSATPDRATQVISDERLAYDGLDYGQAPTVGDATAHATLTEHDGTTATYRETAATFDTYGRPLTVTDLAADVTATGSTVTRTTRDDGRTVTTAYQPTTGIPTTVTQTSPPADPDDPETAQTAVTELHPQRALPIRTIDTNDHHTSLRYDALGRTSHIWLADRDPDDTPSYQFDYRFVEGSPVAVRTRTIGVDGEQDSSYVLYDGLLRERQTQDPGPEDGRLLTDTLYNELGLPERTHAPYHGSGAPGNQIYRPDVTRVETQTRLTYDALGRETTRQLMAGNGDGGEILGTTDTHYFGDRTTVIPPEGDTATTTIQDARGRTIELRQHHERTLDAPFDATHYAYTPRDELARVTDPAGNEWSYEYDQLGRRTHTHDPDAGTTVSTYDDRDQLTTRTDARDATLAHRYDNLGRRTALLDGQGETLADWEYDTLPGAQGQLTAATRYHDGEAYTSRVLEYDALYRVLRSETTIPDSEGALAGSYETATAYAESGLPESHSYPLAGSLPALTVTPRYEDGTLRQVGLDGSQGLYTETIYSLTGKPLQTEMKLDPDAYEAVWINSDYEWGTQRLKTSWSIRFMAGGPDRYETYSYDQAGNVTSINDVSLTGNETQCFQYDYLRRLTEAWAQTGEECATDPADATIGGPAPYWRSYTYDLAGNRLTETLHEQDTTRTYDYPEAGGPQPHTLTSVTQETPEVRSLEEYGYDAAGNTTSRQIGGDTQELTWDNEGRLTEVTEADGTRTEYLYDAAGNRLIGRTATETTLYLGHTEIVLPAEGDVPQATRYVDAGGGHLVVFQNNGDIAYTLADHHGTGQLAVDAWTLEVTQRRTLPFGDVRGPEPTTWPGTRGFVGGTTDTSTGLTHLGAREYDPATGRFISLDPVMDLTDPQQIHGYTYANNNPLTYSDPTGLFFKDIIRGIKSGVQKIADATNTIVGSAGRTYSNRASQAATEYRCGFRCMGQDAQGHQQLCDDACRAAAEYRCGWDCTSEMPVPKQPPLWLQVMGGIVYNAIPLMELPACLVDGDTMACADTGTDLVAGLKAAVVAIRAVIPDTVRRSSNVVCNSFVPGTHVLMADGTTRPIEDVRIGDKVLATDPETGETSARTVTAEITTTGTKHLTTLTIQTDDGHATLVATDNHPFWNQTTQAWTDAADLPVGAELSRPDGSTTTVAAEATRTRTATVHNLTVEGLHTYYVLAGATPILVHNCKWDMANLDEHYDKHVFGEGKRPGEGPDMPEYQHEVDGVDGFDRYQQDACALMCGPRGSNVREVIRSGDGAIIRLDTSTGRIGIMQNGRITSFFRPDDPLAYMENESVR
ncbi:polymorphic toxin-type HINT domain-containing protein [Streptomyces sp. DSM 44915]|uniref:Polymorphic toxin-type HINT domain-containing protein n=1 Tax=Streptomyces chisholmiae TaxID=3075540 RepID=A0ABU2JRQ2_9ACTN|nr:polymorphic toxin-type HINT domain-containing protein [Streptomyces sp. DSM 44915]MDT0267661.1 polymorphic toxin-type HINT domain-containing protein [Streptomyces sp. DSM 44915]